MKLAQSGDVQNLLQEATASSHLQHWAHKAAMLCRLNEAAFGGQLPDDMEFSWNSRMLTTAGVVSGQCVCGSKMTIASDVISICADVSHILELKHLKGFCIDALDCALQGEPISSDIAFGALAVQKSGMQPPSGRLLVLDCSSSAWPFVI